MPGSRPGMTVGATEYGSPGLAALARDDNYNCLSTKSFFNSAIDFAGLRPFGQAFEQFMIVWQR
jgi:hypothetical protein